MHMSDAQGDSRVKSRLAATDVRVDPNIRRATVSPTSDTKKSIEELPTIGLRTTRDQAIRLARVLLTVTQDRDDVELAAKRFEIARPTGPIP